MYRACSAPRCIVLNLDTTCLLHASAVLRSQKGPPDPITKQAGVSKLGWAFWKREKCLASAGARLPGGTNEEDKKYVQNFSSNT